MLRRNEQGRLSHSPKLAELVEGAAKRVLPTEVRLSIRQVTLKRQSSPQPEREPENTTKP
ncbi:hypothetical protein D3C77_653870 [compost metagenome]